jgi:hypothetical protein
MEKEPPVTILDFIVDALELIEDFAWPEEGGVGAQVSGIYDTLVAALALVYDERNPDGAKDPMAVLLGRKGGAKGGPARAAKLSPEVRKEIARKAAMARWHPI